MSNVIKKALNGFSDGAVLSHRHAAYKSALNLALHDKSLNPFQLPINA